jgi:isopentenyldiphosphate isomerase
MEKYDLVDINDNIIGTTDKETSHKDGGIHRVVAIYVFTPDSKLYLQEHIKSGGLFDHSVGGHVIKGEDYDTAAKREGFEELNLNCPLQKISMFYSDESYSSKQIFHMYTIFECTPTKNWQFNPNNEVKKITPMKIKDVVDMMNQEPTRFVPGFLNTMYQYILTKHLPYKLTDYTKQRLIYPVLK